MPTVAGKSLAQIGTVTEPKQVSVLPLLLLACLSGAVLGLVTVIAGGVAAGLLAFFLLFVVATVFDFRVGVITAVLILPISATYLVPRSMFGLKGLNPLNGVLAITTVAVILLYVLFPNRAILPRVGRMTWLYLGALVASALYGATHVGQIPPIFEVLKVISFDSPSGYLRDMLIKPLMILTLGYLLAIAVANAARPERLLIPLFAAALVLPLVVVGFVLFGGVPLSALAAANSRSFLSFLGIHANELGLMFNMSFALALFSAFSTKNHGVRLMLFAVSTFLAAAVMLTFSRGAFLGLLMVCAYLLVKQRRFGLIAATLLVLPFFTLLIPDAVIERAATGIATGDMEAISAGRIDRIWIPLLPELYAHPIIGQGMGSILWSSAARHGSMLTVGHPHSAYLGMLLDFGVLGSLVIIGFFIYVWRYFRALAIICQDTIWMGFFQGGCACVLLLAVQGITDDRFTPTAAQDFLWLAFGIAIGMHARSISRVPVNYSATK